SVPVARPGRRRQADQDRHRRRAQHESETENRHLRRTRRRSEVRQVLPQGRDELRKLQPLPRPDREARRRPGRDRIGRKARRREEAGESESQVCSESQSEIQAESEGTNSEDQRTRKSPGVRKLSAKARAPVKGIEPKPKREVEAGNGLLFSLHIYYI